MTKGHTDIQLILQDGKPAFVVVPYDQWQALIGDTDEEVYIPHEVVELQLKNGLSLIAAWRKYKKFSQAKLGNKIGVSQSGMAQIENPKNEPQEATLKKIAGALGVEVDQLKD